MKDKTNQEIIDEFDYLSNAASSQDCTGLIPSGPTSTEEVEIGRASCRERVSLG